MAGLRLGLLATLFIPNAAIALPDGTVLVTSAETVDQRALPTLLNLPNGTFSTLELVEDFAFVPPHPAGALLGRSYGERGVSVIDPTQFTPPSSQARYYDPLLRSTTTVSLLAATAARSEAEFELRGEIKSLSELLAPTGATLVFSVPEPGLGTSLVACVALLLGFARRRPGQVPCAAHANAPQPVPGQPTSFHRHYA